LKRDQNADNNQDNFANRVQEIPTDLVFSKKFLTDFSKDFHHGFSLFIPKANKSR
jgi:hypothetical protein